MKLGRNDKCPCGSGKKYKKCCMESLAIKSELSKYNEVEKTTTSLIMKYLRSPENESDFQKAVVEYFGSELSEISVNDAEFNFFMAWYIKNYNFNSSFIDRLIKKEKNASLEVKKLLENLKNSNLYLHKIIKLDKGNIAFENLHNGSVVQVFYDVIEQNVNINDVIYSRLYKVGNFYKIFGGSMFIPYFMVEELLKDIEEAWNNSDKSISYDDFIQLHSINIIKKLSNDIPDDRILYNEDNELLQYSSTKYKILDKAKCDFILSNLDNFIKKDNETNIMYEWVRYKDNLPMVLSEITMLEEELLVETDSFERKLKIQEILNRKLKNVISFVDEEYFTIRQLQEEADKDLEQVKISDEVERLILDKMKIEYTPLQIRDAILLVKRCKADLKKLKSESIAATIEYIIANKENLNKTQKDIADKYNVSPTTISKWVKVIQEESN